MSLLAVLKDLMQLAAGEGLGGEPLATMKHQLSEAAGEMLKESWQPEEEAEEEGKGVCVGGGGVGRC